MVVMCRSDAVTCRVRGSSRQFLREAAASTGCCTYEEMLQDADAGITQPIYVQQSPLA